MTVAAEIAHLCGDTPTAQESVLSPASLIQYVRDNGGFVHPDLKLLTGDEAKFGQVSLAGVPSNERSLFVPWSLAETEKQPGPWMEFLNSLGYVFDEVFWKRHSFPGGVYPLIGAANHGAKGEAGKVKETSRGLELYGVDFRYSESPKHLLNQWGIVEE